jgi:hypothetical protein
MPRAGSGWYFNLTHDLVVAAGYSDARQIRNRYFLQKILTEVNCNIGTLSIHRLLPVMLPALLGNTYTIKLHAGPKPNAMWMIRRGWIRPTYIYRDPRDAMLSAFENGQRARAEGRVNAFSSLESIDDAIRFMLEYIHVWREWMAVTEALQVRYEDMLAAYDQQVDHLLHFLQISSEGEKIRSVREQYRPGKSSADDIGMHFHKGGSGRYREVLTPDQLKACEAAFEPYLADMGYA